MNMLRLMVVLVLGLGLVSLPGCSRHVDDGTAEMSVAQTALKAISEGDVATAEPLIDFESLNMMGMDAGKIYASMPEAAKEPFRKSFITGFSSSFKTSGGTFDSFKNWRVQSHDAAKTVVATDGLKGSLYLTVTKRTGASLLSGIGVKP